MASVRSLLLLMALILVVVVSDTQSRKHARERRPLHGATEVEVANTEIVSRQGEPAEFDVTNHDVTNQDITNHDITKPRRGKKKRKNRNRSNARHRASESAWFYCSDGKYPKEVGVSREGRGVMCGKEYPTQSCCSQHDVTMELVGSRLVEQIPEIECAKLLMKLRCAHCSPRSWWLFHAPDRISPPHRRVMPILCPKFCKKFHQACRESVAGLQQENYCDHHTTDEAGPCFPDYEIRRGTID